MPAAVASVDRGWPRFHEHGVGRHCDSRRDLTVSCPVGDVTELRRNRSLLMGGDVATPPPYDDSPRAANPLRPKFHLILATISALLSTRGTMNLEDQAGVYKFQREITLLSLSRTITLSRVHHASKILLYNSTVSGMIALVVGLHIRSSLSRRGSCHDESFPHSVFLYPFYLLSF